MTAAYVGPKNLATRSPTVSEWAPSYSRVEVVSQDCMLWDPQLDMLQSTHILCCIYKNTVKVLHIFSLELQRGGRAWESFCKLACGLVCFPMRLLTILAAIRDNTTCTTVENSPSPKEVLVDSVSPPKILDLEQIVQWTALPISKQSSCLGHLPVEVSLMAFEYFFVHCLKK